MELEQLRQLDAIASVGTLSAASRVLHLSQPALSRSLARLEADLGQPLFDRPGRRLVLNEAGVLALDHARSILRASTEMRRSLDDLAHRTRAVVVGTVAPAPLWRLTALLVERYPERVLTSVTLGRDEVEAKVVDGEVDLGVSLRPHALDGLCSVPLMEENLAVSLPRSHRLAARGAVGASDLDGETFLLYAGIGFWREECERIMPRARFLVQEDRNVFESLLAGTDLPYFVTDAPALGGRVPLGPHRVVVPMVDPTAHVAFHLVCREQARPEVLEVFEWVRRSAI